MLIITGEGGYIISPQARCSDGKFRSGVWACFAINDELDFHTLHWQFHFTFACVRRLLPSQSDFYEYFDEFRDVMRAGHTHFILQPLRHSHDFARIGHRSAAIYAHIYRRAHDIYSCELAAYLLWRYSRCESGRRCTHRIFYKAAVA